MEGQVERIGPGHGQPHGGLTGNLQYTPQPSTNTFDKFGLQQAEQNKIKVESYPVMTPSEFVCWMRGISQFGFQTNVTAAYLLEVAKRVKL